MDTSISYSASVFIKDDKILGLQKFIYKHCMATVGLLQY